MGEPRTIQLKLKYRHGQPCKNMKQTKAGNGTRRQKGLSGSFTRVPPGNGMGK